MEIKITRQRLYLKILKYLKEKAGDITISDFRLYYRTIMIK